MGATTDFRVYKTADRKKVKKAFQAACDDERHDSGNGGYTGTIAEMNSVAEWKDLDLPTVREAENHISDNHEKWEDAMAVSFKLEDGTLGWVVGGWVSE